MAAATRKSVAEHSHYALLGVRRLGRVAHPLADLPADWVRVQISYCGVCGSDISKYEGVRRVGFPLSMGHEWVGVVAAAGPGVRNVEPGAVVTTDLNYRCGVCLQCRRGRSHLCEQGQVGLFSNRGFATLVDIQASYLRKCRSAPAPELALAEPLSCALHALNRTRLDNGERVLVIGAGSLGMCMAFILCNGSQVTPFDVTDINPARLASLARSIEPVGRAVNELHEEYDVVLDASGTVTGLRAACAAVRRGGRVCTVSHLPDHADVSFLPRLLETKDVTLAISYLNGPASGLIEAIRLLELSWTPKWRHVIEVRPMVELPLVFEERSVSTANKVVMDLSGAFSGE